MLHTAILIVVVLLIAGTVVWVLNQAPINQFFKNTIFAVIAISVLLWILQVFGLLSSFPR